MSKGIWFDEIEDCQASLDLAAMLVGKVVKEPAYWKWLIIACHNALQGALVCAISGTDGTGALSDRSATEWRKYLDGDTREIPKRLADFLMLLERGKDSTRTRYKPLSLSDDEVADIKKLHELFRNNFIHFTPKGWTIEVAGMPRILRTATGATEQLFTQVVTGPGNRKRRAESAFEAIFTGFAKLEI